MIPESRRSAVERALGAAFGVREPERFSPLAGQDGVSTALAARIVVKGRPYFLRLSHDTGMGVDPAREIADTRAAAEAGLGPRVWYASAEDWLMITDFVEARPYPTDTASQLGAAIRRLQALPGAPPRRPFFDSVSAFVDRLGSAGLLPTALMAELRGRYDQLASAYPRDAEALVTSHNDLKPPNVLYDGRRIWLVDWEAAFLNDRYSDLAIAGNFFANTPLAEDALLTAYFGRPASEYERARFFLMSQFIHIFYVAVFGLIAARAGASWDADAPLPEFRDYHRRITAGEVDLGVADAKRLYAQVHLAEALSAMASPRFSEAIARMGDRVSPP